MLESGKFKPVNGKLRDEPLDREISCALREAKVLIAWWRQNYNEARPHSSLGHRPPAPVARSIPDPTGGAQSAGRSPHSPISPRKHGLLYSTDRSRQELVTVAGLERPWPNHRNGIFEEANGESRRAGREAG